MSRTVSAQVAARNAAAADLVQARTLLDGVARIDAQIADLRVALTACGSVMDFVDSILNGTTDSSDDAAAADLEARIAALEARKTRALAYIANCETAVDAANEVIRLDRRSRFLTHVVNSDAAIMANPFG